jgi:hypothetical protein
MKAHKRHLTYQDENEDENKSEPKFNGKITKETILQILSVGTALSQDNGRKHPIGPEIFMKLY